MNRKKLARRTALAHKINQKWGLTRALEQQMISGFAAFYVTTQRLELLRPDQIFNFEVM